MQCDNIMELPISLIVLSGESLNKTDKICYFKDFMDFRQDKSETVSNN